MEYQDASPKAKAFTDHAMALKATAEQPEGQSYRLPLLEGETTYSLRLLRDMASGLSVGKLAFVVISWPECYEVQRLPDGSNVKLFYSHLDESGSLIGKPEDMDEAETKVFKLCIEYCSSKSSEFDTYKCNVTPDMISERVIPYALIQRKLASLAVFRKLPSGGIKAALGRLIEKQSLSEVSKEISTGMFETKGQLYKINLT